MTKLVRCPAEVAISLVSGRWKLLIIRNLLKGERRFGELQNALPKVTHKVLSAQLNEMIADGLVDRFDFNEYPKKVIYKLTDLGRSMDVLIYSMHDWAVANRDKLAAQGIHLSESSKYHLHDDQ